MFFLLQAHCNYVLLLLNKAVVVPKCFIKHMCFIVLYFHSHAFFSLEIAKKCFFVLYFLKNVLYFCKLFKWMEYLFQVFIYNTKIGELWVTFLSQILVRLFFGKILNYKTDRQREY